MTAERAIALLISALVAVLLVLLVLWLGDKVIQ